MRVRGTRDIVSELSAELRGLEEEAKAVEKSAIKETQLSQMMALKTRHARITRQIKGLKKRIEAL